MKYIFFLSHGRRMESILCVHAKFAYRQTYNNARTHKHTHTHTHIHTHET